MGMLLEADAYFPSQWKNILSVSVCLMFLKWQYLPSILVLFRQQSRIAGNARGKRIDFLGKQIGSYCEKERVPFGTSQQNQDDFLKPEGISCNKYTVSLYEESKVTCLCIESTRMF